MEWNQDELLRRVMDNKAIFAAILEAFLEEAPSHMAMLQEAMREQDLARAAIEAHALKGIAANMAAEGLMEVALATELAAKNANEYLVRTHLSELLSAFQAMHQLVESALNNLST